MVFEKKHLKGRIRLCSKSEGIICYMRKLWEQELEVAGHIVSTVRKQREMNAGAQFTFSFLFRLVLHGMVPLI